MERGGMATIWRYVLQLNQSSALGKKEWLIWVSEGCWSNMFPSFKILCYHLSGHKSFFSLSSCLKQSKICGECVLCTSTHQPPKLLHKHTNTTYCEGIVQCYLLIHLKSVVSNVIIFGNQYEGYNPCEIPELFSHG